jgi:hypothetical protein
VYETSTGNYNNYAKFGRNICYGVVKVKFSPLQALEALRVVRG